MILADAMLPAVISPHLVHPPRPPDLRPLLEGLLQRCLHHLTRLTIPAPLRDRAG